jgi:prepilin-type N-terminal cleavage/methylation domain-containing protein
MGRVSSALRKRKKNQKGFTLIEMLVVISIMGILAAIVTISMVAVINSAQSRANDAEMHTVQVALDTMAAEQQLNATAICSDPTFSTSDMALFPKNAAVGAPSGSPVPLFPRYLRTETMKRAYKCDLNGIVSPGP